MPQNGKFLSLGDASARLREYGEGFAQPLFEGRPSSISLPASITVMPRGGRALNKSRFPIEGTSATELLWRSSVCDHTTNLENFLSELASLLLSSTYPNLSVSEERQGISVKKPFYQ